ncbi:MAG: phosphatidylserine decarboxylase [Acidobacteriota bacterium]
MVIDGFCYALALGAAGGFVFWLAGPWFAAPIFAVALFCLYFFRDPDRVIPEGPVAVSPADGKVVAVKAESPELTRISVFLNIFDVHVNRAPVAGRIKEVFYKKGRFLVASREAASSENEQNLIVIESDGCEVAFRQIAGLIARRIVCTKQPGDRVTTGERVGMIKFGSRVDVLLGPEWDILVRPGLRVRAGSSALARRKPEVKAG